MPSDSWTRRWIVAYVLLGMVGWGGGWSEAATIHVALTGSDSHPGTAAAPMRTIARGLAGRGPGDTVLVGPGTYREGELRLPSGVTLKAATSERPVLQPGGGDAILVWVAGTTGTTVDGFVVDGGNGTGARLVQFPVYAEGQGITGNTLTNSEIREAHGSCLLVKGVAWTITKNHIHHCGIDKNLDHGIYFQGKNSRIAQNKLHDNACYAIQNYSDPQGPAWQVYGAPDNNTYDSNVFTQNGCGVTLTWGSQHVFRNNLIYRDSVLWPGGGLTGFGTGTVLEGNILVDNSIETIGSGDRGARIVRNTVCRGTIQVREAQLSDNTLTCDGLDVAALEKERLGAPLGGGRPLPLPAPRHLRAVVR